MAERQGVGVEEAVRKEHQMLFRVLQKGKENYRVTKKSQEEKPKMISAGLLIAKLLSISFFKIYFNVIVKSDIQR